MHNCIAFKLISTSHCQTPSMLSRSSLIPPHLPRAEPHLHSNLFSELPAAVAALERLEVLDLSDCQFLHVPAQALQLPALATLRCESECGL